MRDPKRIYTACNAIATIWADLPDWRFGQLMYNFQAYMMREKGIDIFYLEEDKFVECLREYVDQFKL
jgi:hypothetical protein